MNRWALRFYGPRGDRFTERTFRTRRRALRVLAICHLRGTVRPGDGYTLRLERV